LKNINLISEVDFLSINKRSKVDVGDILFGMIGTIGNPVMVKSNTFAIKNVALIKETGTLTNYFLVQYLRNDAIKKLFNKLNVGNTQKFIAIGQIRVLPIFMPSKLEQTKIANFLTAIDNKLTHTQNQLAAVKQYKQGLLQQMFV
jgi:type I restriction enzyme S subunit